MLVSAFGVNIWGIILLINLRLVTNKLEWGVCCVCVALVYYIRELLRKTGFIPFWITESTIRNRRWRRRSKTGDLHLVWMVTEVLIGRHPEIWIMSGDRPDVRGDRWVCEVYSASGFVQNQNGLVNGLCVWHWNSFCVIDVISCMVWIACVAC